MLRNNASVVMRHDAVSFPENSPSSGELSPFYKQCIFGFRLDMTLITHTERIISTHVYVLYSRHFSLVQEKELH